MNTGIDYGYCSHLLLCSIDVIVQFYELFYVDIFSPVLLCITFGERSAIQMIVLYFGILCGCLCASSFKRAHGLLVRRCYEKVFANVLHNNFSCAI